MDKIENLYVALFVGALLMINLAWSLFNLLPILPLDGGRVCEELCEGALLPNPAVTARGIGVSLAGSLVLLGLMNVSGSIPPRIREVLPWFLCFSLWTTLFMGLLAVQNYVELQQFRRAKSWGGFDDADDDAPWRGR
jgi:Zn-dependent protease